MVGIFLSLSAAGVWLLEKGGACRRRRVQKPWIVVMPNGKEDEKGGDE
jgi:hypothetical protein